ncbi:MAG: hypothetical protein WCJ25_00345 [Candidatus Moraniibacteriota bacterium]
MSGWNLGGETFSILDVLKKIEISIPADPKIERRAVDGKIILKNFSFRYGTEDLISLQPVDACKDDGKRRALVLTAVDGCDGKVTILIPTKDEGRLMFLVSLADRKICIHRGTSGSMTIDNYALVAMSIAKGGTIIIKKTIGSGFVLLTYSFDGKRLTETKSFSF